MQWQRKTIAKFQNVTYIVQAIVQAGNSHRQHEAYEERINGWLLSKRPGLGPGHKGVTYGEWDAEEAPASVGK